MKEKRAHNGKLQRERLARGWRQEEVAEKLGVDVRTIRRWESGQPIRPLNISSVIQLFGKSAEELGLIEETTGVTVRIVARLESKESSIPLSGSSEQDQVESAFNNFTLPIQSTSLIGREQEVATLVQLLRNEDIRLLTLTGPGGTGKTRLGVQVASEVQNLFADGVYFVNLAPIREARLVLTAIAQVLGIWEAGGQSLQESLKSYLRAKQILLLIDNFEQVISAAEQIADLLGACPRLKVLVTSRETLHVRSEHEFFVPPLALPTHALAGARQELTLLARNPAIELFVQRAQSVKSDFRLTTTNASTITEICIRLDGLPLAIELAAARSKVLTPRALLTWLEHRLLILTGGPIDAPLRQRTLRNTIEWSYDLLSEEEQRLFRWLALFIGGFTLESAVAYCVRLGDIPVTVLDRLDSLMDKSLVQSVKQIDEEEQRFIMLETLREYGLEKLSDCGEMKQAQHSHAQTYLELAELAEPEMLGPQQAIWLDRLDREAGNLRAAIEWWLEQPDNSGVENALRLSAALERFWDVRGYRTEGRRFLQRALDAKAKTSPSIRARAIDAAIVLAVYQSDLDHAIKLCEENLNLCRTHHDERGIALSIHRLAWIAWARGRLAEARSMEEGALALFRKLGDEWGIASALELTGFIALDQAEYDRARAALDECLILWREQGNDWGLAFSTWLLGCTIFYGEGDGVKALPVLEEGLAYSRKLRHKASASYALTTQGFIYLFRGDIDKARSIFSESMALAEEMGDQRSIAAGLYSFGWVAFIQGDYTTAQTYYWKSLALLKILGHQWITALSIEGLAMTIGAQGQALEEAARLWGAAEALRETISAPAPFVNRAVYEQLKAMLCGQLGEATFASTLSEGRAMTLDDILALSQLGV